MSEPAATLYFDFVDPLSYLLVRELEATGVAPAERLTWHPLELRPPPTPLVGIDDDALAPRWEGARTLARERDISFDPHPLVPWTRKAHELVLHARESGGADVHRLRKRIFEAYLLEGRDIGRVDVLVELALAEGLDRTGTKAVLDVDRHQARVAELRTRALERGVSDTPTLVSGERRLEGFHNGDALGTLLDT